MLIQVRRNLARASASTISEKGKHQADTEMLQKLESLCPTKSYVEWVEHDHIEQDLSDRAPNHFTCSICLEDVQPTDLVHGLSCGHAYHANCLETWLLTGHFLCPLCNQAFFDQIEPESSDV
jgi:hypothetical protein